MLPDLDGFEVCRRLRTGGDHTPVLFLTARDATEDKVRGLTLGGDDYLQKPFSLEELVARTTAVLRRTGQARDERNVLHVRRPRARRRRPPGDARRRRGGAVADGVQPAALPARQPGSRACRRRRSSTTSGSTTSAATAAWSRRTSATCAASSTPTEPKLITTVRGIGYTIRAGTELAVVRLSLRARVLAGMALVVVALAVVARHRHDDDPRHLIDQVDDRLAAAELARPASDDGRGPRAADGRTTACPTSTRACSAPTAS